METVPPVETVVRPSPYRTPLVESVSGLWIHFFPRCDRSPPMFQRHPLFSVAGIMLSPRPSCTCAKTRPRPLLTPIAFLPGTHGGKNRKPPGGRITRRAPVLHIKISTTRVHAPRKTRWKIELLTRFYPVELSCAELSRACQRLFIAIQSFYLSVSSGDV